MLGALNKQQQVVRKCLMLRTSGISLLRTSINFHTRSNSFTSTEQLDQLSEVELPKKGKVVVPKHIQMIGDEMLKLNAFESMILSQYVRVRFFIFLFLTL